MEHGKRKKVISLLKGVSQIKLAYSTVFKLANSTPCRTVYITLLVADFSRIHFVFSAFKFPGECLCYQLYFSSLK